MTRTRWSIAVAVLAMGSPVIQAMPAPVTVETGTPEAEHKLQARLRERLAGHPGEAPLVAASETLPSTVLLLKFYRERKFAPAWLGEEGLTEGVRDLVNALWQADREGLHPDDYHMEPINRLMGEIEADSRPGLETLADLELLLTDGFLTYGSHLLSGRINPYSVDNEWFADRRTGDLHAILQKAVETRHVRQTLAEILPPHPVYQRLRDALARYRTLEKNGGWPRISTGPVVRVGARDPRMGVLRQRLYLTGDLNQKPNDRDIFDPGLERGLTAFQKRHGLDPDGALGVETLKVLNITASERVRQLRVNLERCRWLPADLGDRYIFVNVPDYRLEVREKGQVAMEMKVVVGRKLRQTPVFSSTMTYLVLNPTWTVPITVARLDILDHIREEPDYLQKNGFEVYDGYEESSLLVDPATIHWSSVTAQDLRYKFRQKPGVLNALGQIKFMFPNRFDIYLHDTPSRSLFAKVKRDFSSGCIRIEKPIDLAKYLLQSTPRWTPDMLEGALKKEVEQTILLPDPIPVHLVYLTAWVDEWDKVQFRDDLYGRDEPLNLALHREPAER